ncbi:hypothetical protein [Rhizobium skierniewicense]|nr:hypothetical protein [Rhizobium skierniewicense]NTF34285.1 hypothetical protein [Rhizobium skierniewicense]
MGFKVWGKIDGKRFEQVFASVADWREERKMIERCAAVVVMGMASVEVAA